MAKLIYSAIASLDGYVADEDGTWDWAFPDEEVHAFVNDLERPIGTYLYGRRMYDVMVAWETMDDAGAGRCATTRRSGARPRRSSTRRTLDRAVERAHPDRALVRARRGAGARGRSRPRRVDRRPASSPRQALAAGLVDEVDLVLSPAIVGGGNPALPSGVRVDLELRDERRFANGAVYLSYGVRR